MDRRGARSKRIPFIPGTKPSIRNSQLLISSGIPSLDRIIGGGIPIGSLFLIEEDRYGTYAKVMLRYFMAEGVVTAQPQLIGSKDVHPSKFVSDIPTVITDTPVEKPIVTDEQMKIAWRYQNTRQLIDSSPTGGQVFGHFYDLTKPISKEVVEDGIDIIQWCDNSFPKKDDMFENMTYSRLLTCIQEALKNEQHLVSEIPTGKQVLRITIHSLGSRLWFSDSENDSHQDLLKFLYHFRALLRHSYAVGVITVPVDCLDNSNSIVERIEHLSDIAIKLESFAGSEKQTNPLFKDYHGLLHLRKMPAINTIAPHKTESCDLTFKLRRKTFCIEVLHLPPELGDTVQREQDEEPSDLGCCSQSRKNPLDF